MVGLEEFLVFGRIVGIDALYGKIRGGGLRTPYFPLKMDFGRGHGVSAAALEWSHFFPPSVLQ